MLSALEAKPTFTFPAGRKGSESNNLAFKATATFTLGVPLPPYPASLRLPCAFPSPPARSCSGTEEVRAGPRCPLPFPFARHSPPAAPRAPGAAGADRRTDRQSYRRTDRRRDSRRERPAPAGPGSTAPLRAGRAGQSRAPSSPGPRALPKRFRVCRVTGGPGKAAPASLFCAQPC